MCEQSKDTSGMSVQFSRVCSKCMQSNLPPRPAGAGLVSEFESGRELGPVAGQREGGFCTDIVSLWLEEHVTAGRNGKQKNSSYVAYCFS